MRARFALLLMVLTACGDAAGPSSSGRVQIGMPVFGTVMTADSGRDTLVVILRRGGSPVGPTWLKLTGPGTISPSLARTSGGRLKAEWRYARPAPGQTIQLLLCPADSRGKCTEEATPIVSHTSPALVIQLHQQDDIGEVREE